LKSSFYRVVIRIVASSATSRVKKVITLVQWVKDMRELGCVPYLGEENAEVAGYWPRKVEKVIN
jgi:hypothetical protein